MRQEQVQFKVDLDKEKYDFFQPLIKSVFKVDTIVNHGDIFKLTYTFMIDYIGEIDKKFELLLLLANSGVVVETDIKELSHGRLLVEEVLKKMRQLEIVPLTLA